ncbi:ABC transporter ATP-binding protein [Bradyrhizobium sp. LHD-71]|uniref:ABC transporter ATP-binding protein n=1 Tax=Bradyrhizobium sp. LHD-71 TaxID=3072141 RepID=UPI00280E2558|nr:ABC transporter ATP-binding protein [Bradyrhizobium sp. LHD-71]MDQ8729219.1 ABC transporter ATP-binding protein [Bradyrhizobium sp. LHD-71]
MLTYSNVNVSYGGLPVLKDISLTIKEGECVAIFGHNGAGKTSLLRCSVGDVEGATGTISYRGEPIVRGAVFMNSRRGIGLVPQGHNVFRQLTVRKNLSVAGLNSPGGTLEEVYRLFPVLEQRGNQIAGSLSGGQQQILALGMSLMTKPSILLLDEPSTGLAPVIVNDVMDSLRQINLRGTTVVIVEQNIPATLKLVSRAIVLKAGRIVFDGAGGDLARKEDLWAWF